jgi:hypothetical protein
LSAPEKVVAMARINLGETDDENSQDGEMSVDEAGDDQPETPSDGADETPTEE